MKNYEQEKKVDKLTTVGIKIYTGIMGMEIFLNIQLYRNNL